MNVTLQTVDQYTEMAINSFLTYCVKEELKTNREIIEAFAPINFSGSLQERYELSNDFADKVQSKMTVILGQLFIHEILSDVQKIELAENGKFDVYRYDGTKM